MTTAAANNGRRICDVIHGDCLDVMRGMDAESVDAIVTDPPYGLGFMGKQWDHGIPGVPFWEAALHVAKPGAHLLAFGGTRTFHRLTCAIDDAGWEIRDCIMWVYGSGFPKSLDISKAIDKAQRRDFVRIAIDMGVSLPGRSIDDWTKENHSPGDKWWAKLKEVLPPDTWSAIEREVVGQGYRVRGPSTVDICGRSEGDYDITAPATDAARKWDGWGTALKPAWEPIIVAMKPLDGTFAENAQRHGVAGLNIDGCRIGTDDVLTGSGSPPLRYGGENARPFHADATPKGVNQSPEGRWPANLIHDGSEEVVGLFTGTRNGGQNETSIKGDGMFLSGSHRQGASRFVGDFGSAARFFYTAKASRAERNNGGEVAIDNRHPTVKPVSLLKYLCKLVSTPTGGVILDPFCGSGTTGIGATDNGQDFIGIDDDHESCETARKRIAAATNQFVLGF